MRGSLYNLGEYPALVAGDDWVSGECWLIADEDLPITLQVLDEIECYAKQDDDLYERVVIDCYQTADINTPHHRVFTYYYLHPAHLRDTNRIRPNAAGVCAWSA